MNNQSLDRLIDSLKSEAIEAAEKESESIIQKAKVQAQEIVQQAEAKRDEILTQARQEAQTITNTGKSALHQAERDFTLTIRNDLLNLLGVVLEKEIQKEFRPDLLKEAIVKVVENIGADIELKMPQDFVEELSEYIHNQLQQSSEVVNITADNDRLKRLSIKKTDQGWSYEISPGEVSELLRNHLTGKWVEILKNVQQ